MLFNSYVFWVFLPVVLALYHPLGHRWQNRLLLAASLLFYGWWDVRFLFLFILTTVVDFHCALVIARGSVPGRQRVVESAILVLSAFLCVTVQWNAVHVAGWRVVVDWQGVLPRQWSGWGVLMAAAGLAGLAQVTLPLAARLSEQGRRRAFMIASIVSNLGVLGFFKYCRFFAESFSQVLHAVFGYTPSPWMLQVILPVGISFYTFQSLAYTIDVYRRQVEPVERYLTLATFLSFFPQLVAGPIERAPHLLPQFLRPRRITADHVWEGLYYVLIGMFKKVVIADNMAGIASTIFSTNPAQLTGGECLVGIYAFALQIYGDFSGYSSIAQGVARWLGFDLIANFRMPYLADSPSDFWKRWHISLSSWLRDYLYIPLGGSRGGSLLTYRNLMLTMLLGGLWHGANWTFVAWGAYHGLLLCLWRLFERRGAAPATAGLLGRVVRIIVMFHLVCLGWLLFRAQSIGQAWAMFRLIFADPHFTRFAVFGLNTIIVLGLPMVIYECWLERRGQALALLQTHWLGRGLAYTYLVLVLQLFPAETAHEFIYFQF